MIRLPTIRATLFRLPRWLVRSGIDNPRTTIWFWLALSLSLGAMAAGLKFDTSTSSFLDQSDPAWQIYQQSLDDYGGD